jgi:uncharacterized protein YkwD
MRSPARRFLPFVLSATLLAVLSPVATSAADTSLTSAVMLDTELQTLDLINAQRTVRGLIAVRRDTRIADIARSRAAYMARTGDFDHVQSGGVTVFDLIAARRITWYGAGEIIAWNTAAAPGDSAAMAVRQWMSSPTHKAIIISKAYNYAAFGMAVSATTGRRYFAGVFLKGPDRTGAWARVTSVTTAPVDAVRARVQLNWAGSDTRLQVLTAGFRYFEIQRRSPGGSWVSYGTTTSTSATRLWTQGLTYEFRVRARDRAGNWGAWRTTSITP